MCTLLAHFIATNKHKARSYSSFPGPIRHRLLSTRDELLARRTMLAARPTVCVGTPIPGIHYRLPVSVDDDDMEMSAECK
jgi:hypothetical protein